MNHPERDYLWPCMITCGLVLSTIAGARAQQVQKPVDAQFNAMDSDRDGRLSPAEHAAGAKRMFDFMDANRDGEVTATEMDASQQKLTGHKAGDRDLSSAEKIKVVDTDRNGILTASEHASGSTTMFGRMDTNKDGFVSKPEMAAGHARMLHKQSNSR